MAEKQFQIRAFVVLQGQGCTDDPQPKLVKPQAYRSKERIDLDMVCEEFQATVATEYPIIIVIENWMSAPQGFKILGLPLVTEDLLNKMWKQEETVLHSIPIYHTEDKGSHLSCRLLHLAIEGMRECDQGSKCADWNTEMMNLGEKHFHRIQLVTCSYESNKKTFVVIIGNGLGSRFCIDLQEHYQADDLKYWKLLAQNKLWVLPDLTRLFMKWEPVLDAMRMGQKKAKQSAYDGKRPVMVQTRRLHIHTERVIEFREVIRVQQAIVNHAIYLLGHREPGLKGYFKTDTLCYAEKDFDLLYRLRAIDDQLSYCLITTDKIAEQFQNLVQLVFNLEAASQGQSVALLSALAFFFVPLSYIASLFTIPGFPLEAKLYPAFAIPVLITTISIATGIHKLIKYRDDRLFRGDRLFCYGERKVVRTPPV